ncbi:MAG: hypothetical protein M1814_001231 [Vezdaea aestivalis]|nr:MAG: hypothetical protein M1814_001231 [Vezdaea aestivalis]
MAEPSIPSAAADPERGTLEYKIQKFEAPITNRAQLLFRFQESTTFGVDSPTLWFHDFCCAILTPESFPHPMIRHLEEADFLDKKDLTSLLMCTIPASCDSDIIDAIPVFHRLLLRMGSVPYHLTPEKVLTRRALRSAVLALTHPDIEAQWAVYRDPGIPFYDSPVGWRVLFQCLAADMDLAPDTKGLEDGHSIRSEAEDEDLIAVLARLNQGKERIRHRQMPVACIARRAPIPDRKTLPSSRSTELRGRIPIADLQVLLKLLQSVKKYETKRELQRKKEDWKVVNAAGEEESTTASSLGRTVGWREFQTLSDRVPILINGYKVLLSPFLGGPFDVSDLKSKSKGEAFEYIREAYERQQNA